MTKPKTRILARLKARPLSPEELADVAGGVVPVRTYTFSSDGKTRDLD
jgi:hypothetical protein